MKVVCDSCGSKYSIADEKVRGKVFKIRCKECDEVIVVQGDEQSDNDAQGGYDDEGYGNAQSAAEWYAVVDGEQVGPITPDEIEAYYRDGVLEMSSYVWREGLDDWTPLEEMDEFAHLGDAVAGPDDKTQISEGLAEGGGAESGGEGEAETVVTDPGEFSEMFDDPSQGGQQAEGGGQVAQDDATREISREEQFSTGGESAADETSPQASGEDLFSDFEQSGGGGTASTREAGVDQRDGVQQQNQAPGGGADTRQSGGGSDFESFGGGTDSGATSGQAETGGGGARMAASTSGQSKSSGRSQSGTSGTAATGGGAGAGAQRREGKVGERSENSVLFSLDSVDEMQSVDDSGSGEDVSGAGATTEGSGLIDIQNLAASHAAMKGDQQEEGAGGGGSAGGAAPGAGSSSGPQQLSTQSMQSVPNLNPKGSRQNNTLLVALIIAGAILLVGAIGVVGYIIMQRDAQPTKVVKQTTGAEASGAQAAQEEGSEKSAAGPDDGTNDSGTAGAGADAGKAVAEANTDAGKAQADAGDEQEEEKKAEEKADESDEQRQEVASRDDNSQPDRGSRSPDPEPAATGGTGGGGGGGGGGGSSEDDEDIDNLLNNVGDDEGGGGGGGGSQEAEKNLPKKPSRSDVLSTIRNFSGRVSSCASNSNDQDLSGTMKVKFQVEPSGRVSSTNIQTGKFQGTDVGGCVTGVIKNMKFPETQNGMPVVFPFSIE